MHDTYLLTLCIFYCRTSAGRVDAVALHGAKWPRGGGGSAARKRSSGACQDQERSRSAAHGRPGRPRVLLPSAALPQGADRRRHRGS